MTPIGPAAAGCLLFPGPWLTDGLANLSVKWVLIGVGGLLLVRMALAPYVRRQRSGSVLAPALLEGLDAVIKAVVLVFLLIRPFLFQAFFIPSESMLPLLRKHDRLLISKFVYPARRPRSKEVVVFQAPPGADPGEADFIKRIVAGPGDTVEVAPMRVLVDGKVVLRITPRDSTAIARNSFRPDVALGFTYNE